MTKDEIAQEIYRRIEGSNTVNYAAWTVGLTHNPQERQPQHKADGKDIQHWKQWVADSLDEAQEVESYFINEKGMKGGTGGNLSPSRTVYVYIF